MTTDATLLDAAHARMMADPDDDSARLRYYERLTDAELFLLLDAPAEGDSLQPSTLKTADGEFVLAFDREERLARFAPLGAPYAAMSGRVIAATLAGQKIGLGVNLGVSEAEMMLPAEAIDWLSQMIVRRPAEVTGRPQAIGPPTDLPARLIDAIETKLAGLTGHAGSAIVASVTYEAGPSGHLLAFTDPLPGAEDALAAAVGEALAFSGLETGALDVAFTAADSELANRLSRVGLRFDLPQPTPARTPPPPGSDPNAPPRLT